MRYRLLAIEMSLVSFWGDLSGLMLPFPRKCKQQSINQWWLLFTPLDRLFIASSASFPTRVSGLSEQHFQHLSVVKQATLSLKQTHKPLHTSLFLLAMCVLIVHDWNTSPVRAVYPHAIVAANEGYIIYLCCCSTNIHRGIESTL